MIYIREAHPKDGWWLGKGLPGLMLKLSRSKAATDVYDPKAADERRAVAKDCETALKYGIRTYVDGMDDRVDAAYAASPRRLYLVGVVGIGYYGGGLGRFVFKPKGLGDSLGRYLAPEGT